MDTRSRVPVYIMIYCISFYCSIMNTDVTLQVDHINNEKRLMAQISYPFIVNMMGYAKVAWPLGRI